MFQITENIQRRDVVNKVLIGTRVDLSNTEGQIVSYLIHDGI